MTLPLRTKRLVIALAVLAVVACEIRQQGRAELLMGGHRTVVIGLVRGLAVSTCSKCLLFATAKFTQ